MLSVFAQDLLSLHLSAASSYLWAMSVRLARLSQR